MSVTAQQSAEQAGPGARAATGPRAVEEGLLAEVEVACAEAVRDPALLARPLRVIVPSSALREQLCCALVARGRARVGVRVQTLESLAHEVLECAGEPAPPSLLFGEAVRDLARREPALARDLDRLDDGYAVVEASVVDLLDAGFTAAHLDPLLERAAEAASGSALARAAALLRVAAQISHELAALALGHRCAELARAAELVRDDPDLLPTRAVWIHGFADATGVQIDLLEALARHYESRIWLDLPCDASAFGARLRERLAAAPVVVTADRSEARITVSRHADPEREARAAAAWARARIAAGTAPERVAIVARDLASHRLALRRQLSRFGVPFSGVAERGSITVAGRHLIALCDLVERGGALPVERWLDARALERSVPADLRDALHVLGVASLADLAAAAPARWKSGVRLPARAGFAVGDDGAPRATHRFVASDRMDTLHDVAKAVVRHLEADPPRASLATRAARLAELASLLGWREDTPGTAELGVVIESFSRAGDRPLRRDDFARVLRRALAESATDPIGGNGGGVQVISVMEARARTFDALRVIGLQRGAFPRRVAEDPLLVDALRRALRDVLPDLPVKGEGHDEERFLFAQLLAAAPHVHLSSAERDAMGRARSPSPLLDRATAEVVDDPEPSSSRDALIELACSGTRSEFAAALPHVLADARHALGLRARPVEPLAHARLAVLRELDPRDARRHELGPFLGVVGPARGSLDPRRAAPSVTQLELVARCPWLAFLERILGVEPTPDAQGALPAARDRRRLGNVVHGVLARAHDTGVWPRELPHELVLESALEQANGIALRGFARALARAATPYVEVARQLDASDGGRFSSAETDDVAIVVDAAGRERAIRFRVDRIDELDGVRRFTDWKTGRRKSELDHERGVANGTLIQGHVYASREARARYVYLDPDEEGDRAIDTDTGEAARAAFAASVGALFAARDAGVFVPRLRGPDRDEETDACRFCDVRAACVRGDSGARLRLGAWAEGASFAQRAEGERSPSGVPRDGSELERAALALWRLPGAGK